MTETTEQVAPAAAEARRVGMLLVRASADPAGLADFDLAERVAIIEQLVAWAHAQRAWYITELVRRPAMQPTVRPKNSKALSAECITAKEIATKVRWTRRYAESVVHDSLFLTSSLPQTVEGLARGDVDWNRARAVVEYTAPVADAAAAQARESGASPAEARRAADEACARVEARVHPKSARQNVTQLKLGLHHATMAVDPDAAASRCRKARKGREVWLRPDPDAMVTVGARLPAEDGIRLHNILVDRARALRQAGDPRTLAQLKADLLVDLVTGRAANGFAGGDGAAPAAKTVVRVTVALPTLLGLDAEPGVLGGYAPIPADLARQIAADPESTWYRLITDPATGVLKHCDTQRYTPSAPLRRHDETRDGTCVEPGCLRPAEGCDIDHRKEFRKDGSGGGTCVHNTNPRCGRDHRFKHETGWKVDRVREADTDCPDAGTLTREHLTRPEVHAKLDPHDRVLAGRAPDGTLVYRSPTGHLYLVATEPVLPLPEEEPPF